MRRLSFTLFCLTSLLLHAGSIWEEGSQWDVYYTYQTSGVDSTESVEYMVTYRFLRTDNNYMALEKTVTIDDVVWNTQVQGYIRNDHDSVIYVRPVLEDGSIGDECVLYDFREQYEYGGTVRYGVIGGDVKEEFIDWQEDSLDYYMMNNGDTHCLPSWKGIIYKYGYIGGPMDLFLLEATPGKTNRPKPSNISHVIFSTKGGHKITCMNCKEDEDEIIIPYNEMLTDGTKWECLAINTEQPDLKSTYTIQVKGDTLIGERSCKQIYSAECDIQKTLFEEGRKVYVVNADGNPEVLLDFNLQKGDLLDDVTNVTWVREQENMGYLYRTITIDMGFDCESYFAGDDAPWCYDLIEGIGVSKDQYLNQRFINMENIFSYLLKCWKDGTLVYQVAQEYEYIPFVREGVKWTYSIQDYHYEQDYYTNPARGDNKVYRTFEFRGDTIINGKTYKAVHMYVDDEYSEPIDVIPVYLREKDKMVYGIVPDGQFYDDARLGYLGFMPEWNEDVYSGEEFLLYDFQDPVTYWNNLINDDWDSIQLQLDTIEVGGHHANRLFDSRQEGNYFQVIEGIGAMGMNSYPLAFFMPVTTGIHTTEYYNLEKVVENGEVIYPQDYLEDRYLPVIREGVKWVNEYVLISDEGTTNYYYSYEFKGNYPELDSYNRVFKAVYSKNYDANGVSYGDERLVAGLREDEACILSFRNEPLSWMNNFINFYTYQGNDDVRLLHENLEGMWDIDYYINNQSYPHMNLLNTDNFVKADPIEIDGVMCSRIAYIGEQGDTLAYLVEGIGFDSREWGDPLTPFTQYPDTDCGCYKELCGLSHVVKDGKIIYKGMRYRDDTHVGIDEVITDKTRRSLDENYYNLMGLPVGKDVPTTPGIYIHKGKKIYVSRMP